MSSNSLSCSNVAGLCLLISQLEHHILWTIFFQTEHIPKGFELCQADETWSYRPLRGLKTMSLNDESLPIDPFIKYGTKFPLFIFSQLETGLS